MAVKTHVEVKEEHLLHGKRGDGRTCPVALAVEGAFGAEVTVGNEHLFLRRGDAYGLNTFTRLPTWLRWWISDFDKGRDVDPIDFWIDDDKFVHGVEATYVGITRKEPE